MPSDLVFAPLGGFGEIGMNLSIYGFGDRRRRQWIIIDCGVSFASEEHLPGVDLILPDISYLSKSAKIFWASCSPTPMKTIWARSWICGRG